MKQLLFTLLLLCNLICNAQSQNSAQLIYLPLNGNAIDSLSNSPAQLHGNLTPTIDRLGNQCGALKFDGLSYIQIPNNPIIKSPNYSISVAFWIWLEKPIAGNDSKLPILCKGETLTNAQYALNITRQFGDSYADISISSQLTHRNNNYNACPIDFEKWYFICLTYDENFVQLYINGKLAWQGVNNRSFTPNESDLYIGKVGNSFFKGVLDDLRIFKKGLTSGEVNQLYNYAAAQTANQLTISISNNLSKETEPGKCGAHVTFITPTVNSTCQQVEIKQIQGQQNGTFFDVGEHSITYQALSVSGLRQTKSFTIAVSDNEKPILQCPTDILVRTKEKLGAKVFYKNPLLSDNCPDAKMSLIKGYQSGETFPIGNTNVSFSAMDKAGNQTTCSFNVSVELEVMNENVASNALLEQTKKQDSLLTKPEPTKQIITQPTVSSSNTKESISIKEKLPNSSKPFLTQHEKKDSVVQPLSLKTATKSQSESTQSANRVITPSHKLERELILPIKKSDSLNSKAIALLPPQKFNSVDTISKPAIPSIINTEAREKDKDVKVLDIVPEKKSKSVKKTPPTDDNWTITFINDIVQKNDAGKCGAVVSFNNPKVEGQFGLRAQLKQGKPSGSYFGPGPTHNVYIAEDEYGRTKESAFNVYVKDSEPPKFSCPSDTVILLPKNRRGIVYFYEPPNAKDNCNLDTIWQTLGSKSGCFLQIGVHPFTFKAKDKAGNTQECTYSVYVKDELPEVAQEAPQNLSPILNIGKDSVKYEHKIQVKNCIMTAIIYDDGEEDNDSVSIIFNGQIIVNKAKIKIKENGVIKQVLHLSENLQNYIIAKAWNTGKYGLNTLRIDFYEGDLSETDKREFKNMKPVTSKLLHSKPGNAGGLILDCQ